MNAYGQMQAANASANASEYNAEVSENNAEIAKQQAEWAAQEGVQNAAMSQLKTRADVAGIKTNQAASGIDINSGSAVDVQESARELGMLDALTIRSNAARKAYGFQVEETSDRAQANLDRYMAKNTKTAGKIGAGTTLLAGGTDAYFTHLKSKSVL